MNFVRNQVGQSGQKMGTVKSSLKCLRDLNGAIRAFKDAKKNYTIESC